VRDCVTELESNRSLSFPFAIERSAFPVILITFSSIDVEIVHAIIATTKTKDCHLAANRDGGRGGITLGAQGVARKSEVNERKKARTARAASLSRGKMYRYLHDLSVNVKIQALASASLESISRVISSSCAYIFDGFIGPNRGENVIGTGTGI